MSTEISPINLLKEEIAAAEKELENKKFVLSLLKKKASKPFIETTPMKMYLRVIRALTEPFAGLHERADKAVTDPKGFQREEIVQEATYMLKVCKKVSDNLPLKKRKKYAIDAALTVVALEDSHEGFYFKPIEPLVKDLREEIIRLRKENEL